MSSITSLAIVLALAVALSIEVAESRDFNILAQDSLPLPDAAEGSGLTAASGKLCQLCEQYSTEALLYLKQNETQTEILSILHHECTSLAPLKQQCITLVDYYVPLFFLEVSMVKPEKFCESVHLCKNGMKISLPTQEGTCGLCHHVLLEVLIMLKDPNTKLEVTDLLLKTCSKAQNYEQQARKHQWRACHYLPLCEDDVNQKRRFLPWKSICRDKMKVR
ncbi:unnamed protein product [Urochloa decumbens]|uniref:Pulmonary surfactant-associated protein B n=1 Tax=Urochloa decumbens TaxID=240449 RepID=A0ABC9AGN6_9POAL